MAEYAPLPAAMRAAALALLAGFDDQQHSAARLLFADTTRHRFTYLPRPRPGVCLADLDRDGRKAAHRLLATALSPSGYAQATAIMALEEVLDRHEGWRRGRHSNDFWIVIQGRDLLIEHDNTADGANHAHTVLRHPAHDFGGDALAPPPA